MNKSEYALVVGWEIHVQLATKSKMFERCSADWFGKEPNSVVGPLSLGLPGTLPVPNKQAIQWAILLGKALNCKTHTVSKFDRKHYFYPDLPKGYQISQYDQPFSYDGYYDMKSRRTGEMMRIGITRVHLEEDTGKLIHEGTDSLVDFNRAGVPLCEIVTEPDFTDSQDVKQFLEELQVIVRYLGISDADMEKGSMRLEPNISVRKPGEIGLPNYKVEVKNINSFNFAKRAIDFEYDRHVAMLEKGETPVQETRGYAEGVGKTVSQRIKEEASDYRYMPEPDIPPFALSEAFIADIEAQMPELPHQRCARYETYGVTFADAYVLTRSKDFADYFDSVCLALESHLAKLTFKSATIQAEVAKMLVNKTISTTSVEEAVAKLLTLLQPIEMDADQLGTVIAGVLAENEAVVQSYKAGKESSIMFLVGQVMKGMHGKADAKVVMEELKKGMED